MNKTSMFVWVYLRTLMEMILRGAYANQKHIDYMYIYNTPNVNYMDIVTYTLVSKGQHVTTWQFLHMQPKSIAVSTSLFVSTYHAQPGVLQSKAEITAIPKHCVTASPSLAASSGGLSIERSLPFVLAPSPATGLGFETSFVTVRSTSLGLYYCQ